MWDRPRESLITQLFTDFWGVLLRRPAKSPLNMSRLGYIRLFAVIGRRPLDYNDPRCFETKHPGDV